MLQNILASIGLGGSRIKLELSGTILEQGETLQGTVFVHGGKAAQKVKQLYLHLEATSQYEADDKIRVFDGVVDTYTDNQPFEISGGGFEKEIPFTYQIPLNIPISRGRTRYKLKAGLDIRNAINPSAQLDVTVQPCPEIEAILTAMKQLGFEHKRDSGDFNGKIQWLEYRPTAFFAGTMDEVEMAFGIDSQNVNIHAEVDRRSGGLAGLLMEALDADEKRVDLKLPRNILLSQGKPNVTAAYDALKKFLSSV